MPIPVLAVGATLGEGPVWVERDAALWFVDIKARRIHRFDPLAASSQSWDTPAQVGWILPDNTGRFVVGLQHGLYRFFGGPSLSTLYATSARKGLSPEQLRDQPLAGHLFGLDVGVRGQPGHLAAI
ncbi:SMP-30/gluconolactonase/LRE family protein [Novosphingobium soli]|uniref:SMP-30/gluconolactonase/LRE family protein n=1 Tax=Novosphingobium soli TaxID=574956 RepID=A0ABV6CZ91_9SPHN